MNEVTRTSNERAAFETWLLERQGLDAPAWNEERRCYEHFPAHLAWCAWRDSQSAHEPPAELTHSPEPSAYLKIWENGRRTRVDRTPDVEHWMANCIVTPLYARLPHGPTPSAIDRYSIEMEGDICGAVKVEKLDPNGEWVLFEDVKPFLRAAPPPLDALRHQCCAVGVVGQIDGYEVVRRDSIIDLIDRARASQTKRESPACDGCGEPATDRCPYCQTTSCDQCSNCEHRSAKSHR